MADDEMLDLIYAEVLEGMRQGKKIDRIEINDAHLWNSIVMSDPPLNSSRPILATGSSERNWYWSGREGPSRLR